MLSDRNQGNEKQLQLAREDSESQIPQAWRMARTNNNDNDNTTPFKEEDDMGDLSALRLALVGLSLLAIGTVGFHSLPGMLINTENSSPWVDSFYCAAITLTTVGFGDICPGDDTSMWSKVFLIFYTLTGLGIFQGPIMTMASRWRRRVPGGMGALGTFVIAIGAFIFTYFEGLDQVEAIYASIITGTTIGYGDVTPATQAGKIAVALYAVCAANVVAVMLDPARLLLEDLCRQRRPQRTKSSPTKRHKKIS